MKQGLLNIWWCLWRVAVVVLSALTLFPVPPFILAAFEIWVFKPDQNGFYFQVFIAAQTLAWCFIALVICESIKDKLFYENYHIN